MIHLFCGYEPAESVGFHVFAHSVLARATRPVSIIPLARMGMPIGTNAFTVSRFMVPYLMGFRGAAIFVDASDMLMLGDVSDLADLFDPRYAVQVVKHPDYQTRHRIKYRGTDLECPNCDYGRKNWASVMLLNCGHEAWAGVTPTQLEATPILDLLQLRNVPDEAIGALPDAWNRLVDEGHPVDGAHLLHWTAGIPAFAAYRDAPGAELWHAARRAMEG